MTCDGEFGVGAQAVWSMNGRLAAGEAKANTAEARACEALDNMFKLRTFIEGLHWTVDEKRAHGADLIETEFVCVRSEIEDKFHKLVF